MYNGNHSADQDVNISLDAVAMFFDVPDLALDNGHVLVIGANFTNNFVQQLAPHLLKLSIYQGSLTGKTCEYNLIT